MSQAPQLDKSEMAAAEQANNKLAEQIMVLMARALRDSAKRYPANLRNALSGPTAETKLEISFGGEKAYSAALGANNQLKATYINRISDSQAQFLQDALTKSKGESLDNPMVRDMRVLVNGKPLFQVKDGKVVQNDLPREFKQAIAQLVKPKPLEVSLATSSLESRVSQPQQETPLKVNSTPGTYQAEPNASQSPVTEAKTAAQLKAIEVKSAVRSQINEYLAPVNAAKVERSAKHLMQAYGDGTSYNKAATHAYSMNQKGEVSIARQSDQAVVFQKGEVTKAATSDDILKLNALPSQLGQIKAAQLQTSQKQEMEVG